MAESIKQAIVKGSSERPWLYRWESADCTVHCIRHAFDISYDLAWKLCSAHGRAAGQGFQFQRLLLPALNVTDLTPAFRGMTLNQVLPVLALGTFIIATKGHVFTVKQGEILNHEPINYRDILGCWKIKDQKEI
jgi:hypothetical protein